MNNSNSGVEAIGKAIVGMPGLVVTIFEMIYSNEIDHAKKDMWNFYYDTFNAKLDSIAEERGSISTKDLMLAVLETNREMIERKSVTISIFEINGRKVNVNNVSEVQLLLFFAKSYFRGYDIDFDFQDYSNLINNTAFILPMRPKPLLNPQGEKVERVTRNR